MDHDSVTASPQGLSAEAFQPLPAHAVVDEAALIVSGTRRGSRVRRESARPEPSTRETIHLFHRGGDCDSGVRIPLLLFLIANV